VRESNMGLLDDTLISIKPVDESRAEHVQKLLDNKTKPPGSLGRLEELAKRVSLVTGNDRPDVSKKVIFVFAGDHGVTDEGVSAYAKVVTAQMVLNFVAGGAGVNVLARHVGSDVVVCDIGVDHDFEPVEGLRIVKVRKGTDNMAAGPAMSREDAVRAVEVGIGLANEFASRGYGLMGTGDMGIGNTTPSAAITAVMSGKPVEEVTGYGTGITEDSYRNKIDVIKRAIDTNKPDRSDAIDVLMKVGGLEIAGIAGVMLGAAANGIPVVVDGFISTAGALVALGLKPELSGYMIAAHRSVEAGHASALDALGQTPLLELGMRLGEGTGGALAMGLIDAGVKVLNEMATFESAGVEGDKVN